MSISSDRRATLAAGLAATQARITAACVAAGRDPAEVTLIVVTKTYPASDAVLLAELGVREMGENRDQEAAPKAAALAAAGVAVRWHFIGQLQRNKCRSVVEYASAVHSVDSVRLVTALAGAAQQRRTEPLDVLVQVSLDRQAHRGGAIADSDDPDQGLAAVLAAVEAAPSLRLRGLMAVAPLGEEAGEAFARLAKIADSVRQIYPHATWLSAGMSEDLTEAISYGATHVRVGSAVLGRRAALE